MNILSKILAILLILGSLWAIPLKDSNCTSSFSIASQKIVLPIGYYDNYINKNGSVMPQILNFNYVTSNMDTGYVYCLGVKKGSGWECVNNVDTIMESSNVNYVTVDQRSRTYFLIDRKDAIIDFKLPLVGALTHNSNITLAFLMKRENVNELACPDETKVLSLELAKFKYGYKINQSAERDTDGNRKFQTTATIYNPHKVDFKIYDLYSKDAMILSEAEKTIPLTIFDNKYGGFCGKLDTGFNDVHLREGDDYFCKTLVIDDFNFSAFTDSIQSNDSALLSYIKVGSVKTTDVSKGELPFEMLGIDKASKLIRAGFKEFKTAYSGNNIIILVGPIAKDKLTLELIKVQKLIPDATVFPK